MQSQRIARNIDNAETQAQQGAQADSNHENTCKMHNDETMQHG